MNIILEGNECTYKTTFAQRIVEDRKMNFAKGSSFASAKGTPAELFEDYKRIFSVDNTVFDRSFYSNIVYATLYPEFTILTWDQVKELEDMLRSTTAVVWCKAPTEIIKERLAIRGDEHVEANMIEAINNQYEIVMPKSSLTVIPYNTNERTMDNFYNGLIKHMMENWQ